MNKTLEKYETRVDKVNSLLCVGLDPDVAKMPERFRALESPLFEFNKYIIEATAEFVSVFKTNIAFYEAQGAKGIKELKMTMEYLHTNHPDIFTICDAKRGDIGNTNEQYAIELFDNLGFDAFTVHPYMGKESLLPLLARKDKTSIILVRTSNPGAGEIQDLIVCDARTNADSTRTDAESNNCKPLWKKIAENIRDSWNENGNCMLVVGATYPEEMRTLREIMGDMTFLMPGVGGQGGELESAVHAGLNSAKKGLIVNASRSIIYSENPAESAKKLRNDINGYR